MMQRQLLPAAYLVLGMCMLACGGEKRPSGPDLRAPAAIVVVPDSPEAGRVTSVSGPPA